MRTLAFPPSEMRIIGGFDQRSDNLIYVFKRIPLAAGLILDCGRDKGGNRMPIRRLLKNPDER